MPSSHDCVVSACVYVRDDFVFMSRLYCAPGVAVGMKRGKGLPLFVVVRRARKFKDRGKDVGTRAIFLLLQGRPLCLVFLSVFTGARQKKCLRSSCCFAHPFFLVRAGVPSSV